MVCLGFLSYLILFRVSYTLFFFLFANRQSSSQTTKRTHPHSSHSTNIRTGAHHPTTPPIVFVATTYPSVCLFHSSCFAEAADSYVFFSLSLPFFMLVLLRTQKPQTRRRTRQPRCRLSIPTIRNLQRQGRAEPFALPPCSCGRLYWRGSRMGGSDPFRIIAAL